MAQNEQLPPEEDDHSTDANSFSTLTTRKSVTKEVVSVPLVTVADGSHSSTPKSPVRAHTTSEASAEAEHSPNRKSLLGCNRFHEDACSECCTDENTLLPDNNSEFQSNYSINELPGYHLKGDLIINQLPAPPDGGFGWVIVGAAFVCNLVVDGVSNSFGPFMSAYQLAFGSSKAATSVIGSLLIGVYLLAGPISGALLNNFEARKVVIAGAILSSAAFFLSTLSPNIFVHYLLYGVFGGIGFSFIYLPAIVIVSQYFEAKRALATGISVAGSGFGTFLIPLVLKSFLELYGWQAALYVTALLTLLCAFCAILFRSLPMPAFDLEKQNKLNEELKQQALLAALQQVESESNVSEEEEANNGGISPPRRSGATRTSSECTDGQPLLTANGVEVGAAVGEQADEGNDMDASPITPHNRPPLSPILEGISRRLSKKRGGSQHHYQQQPQQQGTTEAGGAMLGRHPTIVSSTRTRKPTLASVTSESVWMGSSTQLRQSRLNLCSQLSRVSARSYAQSLSRISQAPAQSIKASDSVLSVAMSGTEPKEFARPLSRNDIFLQGSIRNLKEFENEGGNFHRYRGSQISIPLTVAAQNLSSVVSQVGAGDMAESNSCRFGGSQYSRITGGAFGVGEFEEDVVNNDSKLRCIPFPIRHALAQMVDLSLLFEPVMSIICLSNILAMLGFYVPFVFLTDLASSKGISDAEATFLLPFIGIANTLGRVFFGWMADRRWVTALCINNASLVLCGLLTVLCPLLPNYWSLSLYACLFGFIVAAYVCLTSIVLADLLGVERLTNSFGLVVVSRGFASLLGTPIAGVVYDLSDSYSASFIYAGFLILLSGLVSCLVSTVHRHQRSQLKNEGDYEDKLKRPITTTVEQDAQSGKLSVLTEHSEENLTEYQRTIQSINQQRALMYELDEYRKRSQRLDEGHEDEAEEQEQEGGGEAAQKREGDTQVGNTEKEVEGAEREAAKKETRGGEGDAEKETEGAESEAAKKKTRKWESDDMKKITVKKDEAHTQKTETAEVKAGKKAEEVGQESQYEQKEGQRSESANISLTGIGTANSAAIPLQVL